MKILWIIVIVLAIGGVYYFMSTTDDNEQGAENNNPTQQVPINDGAEPLVEEMVIEKDDGSMKEEKAEVKEFTVVGTNFKFDASEIMVNKGDTVRIIFVNGDGFHDWVIDEFNARTKQIRTDETETIEFVADQTGTFEYYCSVGKHREFGMFGKLIVK
jgi:plastocyanin